MPELHLTRQPNQSQDEFMKNVRLSRNILDQAARTIRTASGQDVITLLKYAYYQATNIVPDTRNLYTITLYGELSNKLIQNKSALDIALDGTLPHSPSEKERLTRLHQKICRTLSDATAVLETGGELNAEYNDDLIFMTKHGSVVNLTDSQLRELIAPYETALQNAYEDDLNTKKPIS